MKTTAATEWSWKTTDLSRETVARYFGMGVARDGESFIAHVIAKHAEFGADAIRRAAIHCESRARGAWDANERESHAAWKSLASLLRSGVFS